MGFTPGMETLAARLESFSIAHPASKKRASNAKSAKKLTWPHRFPEPSQLSQAGFFYKPMSTAPDNTSCFLCQVNIDGWEEDDCAVQEHVNLSPSCGWAIIASIEKEVENEYPQLENPLDERVLGARRMTFGINWPHENKRGWTCKTEKMIQAGWYYCPTAESDDYAKCCYCSLSLDGWEPKDDPYEEHYSRSPGCPFFALCGQTGAKASRGKKNRGSRGSRVSVQPDASEEIAVAEIVLDGSDNASPAPEEILEHERRAKGSKKGTKRQKPGLRPKGKFAKTRAENSALGSSFVEPEDDNFEVKIDQHSSQSLRGKKRNSDEMSQDVNPVVASSNPVTQVQPRPTKRRGTRSSVAYARKDPVSTLEFNMDDDTRMTGAETMPPPAPKQRQVGKRGRPRYSSNTRKVSAASTASKASLRATVSDDDEIDAAVEADLDRPLTEDESEPEEVEAPKIKSRRLTRTRPGSNKATASVAPARRTTRANSVTVDDRSLNNTNMPSQELNLGLSEHIKVVALSVTELAEEEIIGKKQSDEEIVSPNLKSSAKAETGKEQVLRVEISNKASDKDERRTTSIVQSQEEKQPSRGIPTHNSQPSRTSKDFSASTNLKSPVTGSTIDVDDSRPETDVNVAGQLHSKKGRKKGPVATKKGKGAKYLPPTNQRTETDSQAEVGKQDFLDERIQPALPSKEVDVGDAKADEDPKSDRQMPTDQAIAVSVPLSKEAVPSTETASAQTSKFTADNHWSYAKGDLITPADSADQSDRESGIARSPATQLQAPSPRQTPKAAASPQSSDAENQPPSSRPSALRPPLSTQTPSKIRSPRIPLAVTTPTASSTKGDRFRLQSTLPWTAIDFEKIFTVSPAAGKENTLGCNTIALKQKLSSPEKDMTVEEWIRWNAQRGEDQLRGDCERLVGRFEDEGVRALKTLEGIICVE